MAQENRINFASAQQLNDTVLTIGGTVLGFSIAFLSRADSLEFTLLLKEAWTLLAVSILLNVFSRVVSPEPGDSDRFAILCWRFLAPLSAGAFLSGLGLLTAFGVMNV
ncbi:MAG: hypothetical protein J4O11_01375 [Chloroflexi bacterium]|nr:hypothetical protein [Chloroflexota bacterium]MCH8891962.1 hypothetical protein [Chloroflexota bacterium]MCI0896926.1 hypothetical protein [Chloroflexota bacterium]